MEKKTIIKIVLIILLIIVVLFLLNTLRKFFILQEMQNNANMYVSSVNFHKKVITKENNNTTITTDVYKKDEKKLAVISNEEAKYKTSLYYDETKCDEFYETSEGKRAKLNTKATLIEPLIFNYISTENGWVRFWSSIYTNIKEVELNGEKCYLITGNLNSAFLFTKSDEKEIYIDKSTGLCVKIVYNNGKIEEIVHEFDTVSDEIFIEPDVKQYEVVS